MKLDIPTHSQSRRDLLKLTGIAALGSVALSGRSLAAAIAGGCSIALIVPPDDALANSQPASWALGELESALKLQGATVRRVSRPADLKTDEFAVLVAGMKTALAGEMLSQAGSPAPAGPEAIVLLQGKLEGHPVLLAAGADPLGLVYALTELADRVKCLRTTRSALEFSRPVIERPASRIRSITRQFSSEIEDKEWFHDRDNWRAYLDLMAYSRLNRVSFVLGMAYNAVQRITDGYFVFPYPFLVDVPGYSVRAEGLPDAERERNLETLKFIARETARRGLHFQFGIWTLAYVWSISPNANYRIKGLTDEIHPLYCRDALAMILKEVPEISGMTLRVHSESGIPRGAQDFWRIQFDAIAKCGRRCEIDMHGKSLEPATLELALATGQPVVISPKHCGEHLGLPYLQASIQKRQMVRPDQIVDTGKGILQGERGYTRYSYADYLVENRNWDVLVRVWPGTQRFLLSGDPETYAGYGRNASFCAAAGIELSGPLDFKGRCGTGLAGGRNAYADASLKTRYDFEKYDYFYRLWGRLGYNPDTDPDVWRRWLRREFGSAALAVENALAPASRVLPLFTLVHGPSGSCAAYWPEIYWNIPIAKTDVAEPFPEQPAPKLFGNVSPFDPQLFQSGDECGDALVAGGAIARYTPIEVGQWMREMADSSETALAEARRLLGPAAQQPAFRRIEEDVLILVGLARFFDGKLRATALWRVFTKTSQRAAAEAAIGIYAKAVEAWATMARRAARVYVADITFGKETVRGHWLSRLPLLEEDIADLRQRLAAAPPSPEDDTAASASRAVAYASSNPKRPSVEFRHVPKAKFVAGEPLPVELGCAEARKATLHYRRVNQAWSWCSVAMTRQGEAFAGTIPADYTDSRWPLQYYFEVETSPSRALLLPPLAANLANTPYYVIHRV